MTAPMDRVLASPPVAEAETTGGGVAARTAVKLIQIYQLARTGRTSPCRFLPTCSQYAIMAIERHGLRRGLRLTAGRLGRCRPGGPFGSDPVPE
jgi:putative membrane protein insertion efficiency factor